MIECLVLGSLLVVLACAVQILKLYRALPGDGERRWADRPDVRRRREMEQQEEALAAERRLRAAPGFRLAA